MHRQLFSLLVLLLPIQLGYHLWPSWSVVLGRRVDFLSPTVYLTDILVFLLMLTWGIDKLPHRRKKPTRLVVLGAVGVVMFVAFNVYGAANRMAAWYAWIKAAEFFALGLYVYKARPERKTIAVFFSWSVLYSSVIAIGQFLSQRSLGGPLWFLGERTFTADTPGIARAVLNGREVMRAYGTFPHPNVLGGFLAITLPLIIETMRKSLPHSRSAFYAVSAALGLVALVLTFSRSAMVIFAFIMSWWLWRAKKFFFLVPLFVVFLLPFSWTDESVVVRNQLNGSAIDMFLRSPLLGVGLGNFLIELPSYLPSRTIYFLQPVHNTYLLLLSEVGLAGVAGILFWVWRVKNHIRFSVSLGAILFLGLVDHYFLTLQQGQLLLTIMVALALRV